MGNLLQSPNKEYIDAAEGEAHGQTWGVSSIQGWRTEMEDQHLIDTSIPGIEGHSIYAVFDGHGGKNAAIFAAERLVNILVNSRSFASYISDQRPESLAGALQEAFIMTDAQMRLHFNPRTNPSERSGCTAIATVVTPTHIITANAGDSRGLLARSGANVALSFDHKPWLEVEQARIEAAGGSVCYKRVDGELAVSRALGDFQYKDAALAAEACKVTANPDVDIQVRSAADEFLVLACDGIWDVMDNDEVIRSVTSYAQLLGEGNPRLLCEELIEDCLAKQSKDNMSVIVVLFESGRALVTPERRGVMGIREARELKKAAKSAN